MRNKRKNRIYFLLILLLGISIGFAALATTLKINGTANIGKNTWDVHWANVGDIQKSSTTTITTGAKVNENDSTEVDFEVTLNQPGDYYEFQVDAVNAGTLDAMANIVSKTTVPSYASLTVKYADGEEINKYDLLAKAPDPTAEPPVYTTERIKVRIEFKRDIDPEDLAEIGDNESIDIAINVPYDQADDNAKDRHGLKLGDYFTLVPDASSYEVLSLDTGYSENQTITPNELTLWRIVGFNDDGTIEAISEYTSSTDVHMVGVTAYKKYIYTLQKIAEQYAKDGYTVGTRIFGYDGQTPIISDTSSFDGSDTTQPANDELITTGWPLTGTGEELDGGVYGDTLYLRDLQMVANVYLSDPGHEEETGGDTRGMAARIVNSDEGALYWVASRSWLSRYRHREFGGRQAGTVYFAAQSFSTYANGSWYLNNDYARKIRPMITVKSNVTVASGTGAKNDPFIFN